jgi:hypothetical protein
MIQRKRRSERINKRKDTLIKKAYELRKFNSMNIALIICKHDRYTMYRSRNHALWPPSMAEIVSDRSIGRYD